MIYDENYPTYINEDLNDNIRTIEPSLIKYLTRIRSYNIDFNDICNFKLEDDNIDTEYEDDDITDNDEINTDNDEIDIDTDIDEIDNNEIVVSEVVVNENDKDDKITFHSHMTPRLSMILSTNQINVNIEEENKILRQKLTKQKTESMSKFYDEIVNKSSNKKHYILSVSYKHCDCRINMTDLETLSTDEIDNLYECLYILEQKFKSLDFIETILKSILRLIEETTIYYLPKLRYLKGISSIDSDSLKITKEHIRNKINLNNNTPFIDIGMFIFKTVLNNYYEEYGSRNN